MSENVEKVEWGIRYPGHSEPANYGTTGEHLARQAAENDLAGQLVRRPYIEWRRSDVSQDFTYECVWGCTVEVVDSVQMPHRCEGRRLVFDLLNRWLPLEPEDAPDLAIAVVAALEPLVRERLGKACDPDHLEATP